MNTFLAEFVHRSTDAHDIIHSLLCVLIIGLAALAIWWVGNYFLKVFTAPPAAAKIWEGLFILLGLFVVVNFLLGLVGYPLVAW